jgi:hypothetical protein
MLAQKTQELLAMDQRRDVLITNRSAERLAQSPGDTQATHWISVLDAGYQNKSQADEERKSGYQIDLELPLFDFGATRVARSEAIYMQAF